jgi:hypothetical protein
MLPLNDSTPPTELAVVGERKDNPDDLLLIGPDGQYYAYSLEEGNPHPIELDDGWHVEPVSSEDLFT